jgi:polyhydroxyalkanoate synthesis regulator phasin
MSRRNKDQAGNTEAAAAEDTETLDVAAMFRQLTQQIADAARTSADAARTMEQQIADAARTSADAARTTEEAARASAEALRADIAEAARKSAEAARTTEEAARTSAAALRADIADAARTTAETLTAKLQEQSNRFEEQSRRLEEQIASQLRGEISRLEGGIDREVTAANGRIDELRREVERHNAAIADSQGQVGSQLSLLANRLDSVQRELYTRVQSVEAARSADSVATRDQLPLAPSPTTSVSGGGGSTKA